MQISAKKIPVSFLESSLKQSFTIIGEGKKLELALDEWGLTILDSPVEIFVINDDELADKLRKIYPKHKVYADGYSRVRVESKDLVIVATDEIQATFDISVDKTLLSKVEKLVGLKPDPVEEMKWRGVATRLIIAFALMVMGHILISYLPLPSFRSILIELRPYFDEMFLWFVLTGFLAQMVDGTLSMGYGVTSATCLISMGVNPVSVSAAIHTSEVFSSGISGYSHYKFGNVNKKLFRHLVIPGVIGAILGALMLVFLGERAGKWLMPIVAVYAMFLGLKILIKAFNENKRVQKVKRVGWLAWIGGFLDSFGGGGWGPIVTSTLISKGRSPRYTIGSVSLTEFFITMASALTFFVTAGVGHWNVVLGLLIGGAIAAPFAARLAGKLPRKTMMIAVGILVMIWCMRLLIKSFA